MNKYKIKETDVNMYEYRGYTISGNDRIGYVCISPYGAFSPKAYNTIEDAKAANKGGTNSANKRIYNE